MEATPKLPDIANGGPDGIERCRCGQPQNPTNLSHCLGGHFWKDNTKSGKSTQRYLEEEQEHIIPARDRHLKDLGWDSPDSAPLHVVDYCNELAALPLALRNARRKGTNEYTSLLEKYQKLSRYYLKFRNPTARRGQAVSEMSEEELLLLLDSLREQVQDFIATKEEQKAQARADLQSAVPNDQSEFALGSRDTRSNAFPRSSASDQPEPKPPTDPTPEVYVYGRLVTEEQVRHCMADFGDLAAYESGRISKREAYEQTRNFLKNSMECNPR